MHIETDKANTAVFQFIGLCVGFLLMWLARHFTWQDTSLASAFFLGLMIAILGGFSLIISESRIIDVDEKRKHIVLNVITKFKNVKLFFNFSDIDYLSVGVLGSRSDGSEYFDIIIHTKSGKQTYLFGGCAYSGRMNNSSMEKLKIDIEYLINNAI